MMSHRIIVLGLLTAASVASFSAGAQTVPPLASVTVDLPPGTDLFPGGDAAQAVNGNCLACHSADMVLNQPKLPSSTWQAEIDKMRNAYKAPVVATDVPAILQYLDKLSGGA